MKSRIARGQGKTRQVHTSIFKVSLPSTGQNKLCGQAQSRAWEFWQENSKHYRNTVIPSKVKDKLVHLYAPKEKEKVKILVVNLLGSQRQHIHYIWCYDFKTIWNYHLSAGSLLRKNSLGVFWISLLPVSKALTVFYSRIIFQRIFV